MKTPGYQLKNWIMALSLAGMLTACSGDPTADLETYADASHLAGGLGGRTGRDTVIDDQRGPPRQRDVIMPPPESF